MAVNPYESPGTKCEPDEPARKRSFFDWLLLAMSLLGAAHFAISLLLWGIALYVSMDRLPTLPEWMALLSAIPALVCFVFFALASMRACRRDRRARRYLLAAVVLTVATFIFDVSTRNFQMHVEWTMDESPPPFIYFNFWWYDERWLQ